MKTAAGFSALAHAQPGPDGKDPHTMMVELPAPGGGISRFELRPRPKFSARNRRPPFTRLAYASAHTVAKAPVTKTPGAGAGFLAMEAMDWEATLQFRHHLWDQGLGVAEAMDTAQRETMGWDASSHLISLTLEAAQGDPSRPVIAGAGVDHLTQAEPTIAHLVDGYLHQVEFIHQRGGRAILLPTAHLTQSFQEPRFFVEVYRAVAAQVSQPVFVHWPGGGPAPALEGYFPGDSCWEIMADNPNLLGVKVALLDREREETIRRRLAVQGQIVLTGDDFHFAPLIRGSGELLAETPFEFEGVSYPMLDSSHALLGIFDGIATLASEALGCLAQGHADTAERMLARAAPLARHIFSPPTPYYQVGLVFLAWLNGHQNHCHLLGNLERQRSQAHYVELFKLANKAGVLDDPEAAYARFLPQLGFTALGRAV